jgi:hypothetical protein
MRISHKIRVAATSALIASVVVPVTARAQVSDSLEIPGVLSAALADVRADFPIGRVYLDRVVADTTRRLLPPLIKRREHRFPQDWAAPNGVITVQTEVATPDCSPGYLHCRMPAGVVATIAMSDPVIAGDSAHVMVRYSQVAGVVSPRVMTTVELITLTKDDGTWKVAKRKIKATA